MLRRKFTIYVFQKSLLLFNSCAWKIRLKLVSLIRKKRELVLNMTRSLFRQELFRMFVLADLVIGKPSLSVCVIHSS